MKVKAHESPWRFTNGFDFSLDSHNSVSVILVGEGGESNSGDTAPMFVICHKPCFWKALVAFAFVGRHVQVLWTSKTRLC